MVWVCVAAFVELPHGQMEYGIGEYGQRIGALKSIDFFSAIRMMSEQLASCRCAGAGPRSISCRFFRDIFIRGIEFVPPIVAVNVFFAR